MNLNFIKKTFKKEDKIFLCVSDGGNCLLTKIKPDIINLQLPYKKQLIAFLEETIETLKGGKK